MLINRLAYWNGVYLIDESVPNALVVDWNTYINFGEFLKYTKKWRKSNFFIE